MSEEAPLSNTIIQILQFRDEVLALDKDAFTRKSDLGELNYFKELEGDYIELQAYLRKFTGSILSQIPEINLTVILQLTTNIKTSIAQIKAITVTPPPPQPGQAVGAYPANYFQTQKNAIVVGFKNNFRSFFNATNSFIAYGISASVGIDDFIHKKDELEKMVEDSKKLHATQKNLTSNTQQIATNNKLDSEKTEFENQVGKHNRNSMYWLGGSIGILIVIFAYILCSFYTEDLKTAFADLVKSESTVKGLIVADYSYSYFIIHVIRLLLVRLLFISFSSFLLIFCIKNYNIQKHNAEIMQHKANCITAYQFLEKSISTPTAKDEVLSLALKAVFEQQETGYRGEDAKMGNPNFIANFIESKLNKEKP